jgi:hypothetical protein
MPMLMADLPFQYQTIKSEIDGAVASVIRDSAFIRCPVSTPSGNLHAPPCLAMSAMQVQPADEVIATAYSCISPSAMITHAGARRPNGIFFEIYL